MSQREQSRAVLDSQMRRWSALSCEQLAAELKELQAYELEVDSKAYQVEVQLLENTDQYLHVAISVDDGSLRRAFRPLSDSFIVQKR
jgi:hypothetical protein